MKIYAFADEASPLLSGQIEAMHRNGLNGLEIRGVDGINVSDLTIEQARDIRYKLDAAGLVVWSIGSPIGKISITDAFEPHLEKMKHTLKIAEVLGAKNLRLFSFYIPAGEKPEDYKDEVFARLKQFVAAAEGKDITLCHENEKDIYGDIATRCLEIHQEIPQLKCILDPANFVQCGQDPLEAWNMLHSYIHYLHIKDAMKDGRVVPAGKGIGKVPAILDSFAAQGGDAVTVEPHLAVFEGLKDLEQGANTSEINSFTYASNDEAFDAACNALKELL